MRRFAILVVLVILSLPAFAAPVLAAAPTNDTYAGRTVIGSLPFSDSLDTSEATTDADDVDINAGCAPATDASVWYELTLAVDVAVVVDVTDADYTAGVIIATGSPGSFSQVTCGPQFVAFEAVAGETYVILVFDDQLDGGGNGGSITIAADEAPPPPVIDAEIDPEGTYNPITGVATISGTVTCSEPILVDVSLTVFQEIGRHVVLGGGFASVECGPEGTSGPIEIFSFTSSFNPGRVHVVADLFGCTFLCTDVHVEADVRLHPAPAQPSPTEPPSVENDEPDGAFPIGLDETIEQITVDATAGPDDPAECVAEPVPPSGHTVWYAFTAPADGSFAADTSGSDYDTVAFVLDATRAVVGCDDDITPDVDRASRAVFEATEGETYLVMVGSFEGTGGGLLLLTVATADPPPPPPPGGEPPANDDREDAITLAVGDTVGPVDTADATTAEDDPVPSCTGPAGHSVWYTVTPDVSGWIEVTTFGSDYDTVVVVLDGDAEVACNDDTDGLQSRTVFLGEAGVTYHLMIASFPGAPGGLLELSVQASEPPLTVELGDDLAAWLDTGSGMVTLTGTVTCSEAATVDLFAFVEQQNGRFLAFGEGGAFVEDCSPEGSPFSVLVAGLEPFRPGDALAFVDAFAFTDDESAFASTGGTVRLRPAGARL